MSDIPAVSVCLGLTHCSKAVTKGLGRRNVKTIWGDWSGPASLSCDLQHLQKARPAARRFQSSCFVTRGLRCGCNLTGEARRRWHHVEDRFGVDKCCWGATINSGVTRFAEKGN
jgi:hypothetical protein